MKTNLAGIEYLKTKLENNNMINEAKRVEEILGKYKITHDDNLLNEIIEIEKNQKVEKFTNVMFLLIENYRLKKKPLPNMYNIS